MNSLVHRLRAIVGRRHVITDSERARPYTTGCRFGSGPVVAVVRPGTLVEQWRVLQACVAADHIIIVQAANTGLTGGSTPDGVYDRPVVVVSTTRLRGIHLLRGGRQAICLPGATLNQLERKLARLGREPHSVIGSSCIGASVIGGICNNSGGALIRRGPAYTEYSLFAQVGEDGALTLNNHLGVALGSAPEEILTALEHGDFTDRDIIDDLRAASAGNYTDQVRDLKSSRPARFNADPERLFEASGSAGRIAVFAVRVDTFPADERTKTFYIGTNDTSELSELRRRLLAPGESLPVSGEYIHRTAFDLASEYGKDIFLAIQLLGTDRLPALFSLRNRIDRLARRLPLLPASLSDRIMQALARLFPQHLPERLLRFRERFEHHLILKVADCGIEDARETLRAIFPSASGDMFECTEEEARKSFLHRFAVAGAAIRYRAIHSAQLEGLISLDVALPRNTTDWFEHLPAEIDDQLVHKVYYGHFFCHVFHQDYLVRKGVGVEALEHRMLQLLDERGAEYPAEHNVGHHYLAKPPLADHYRRLDPGNIFNPGLGRTSRLRGWAVASKAQAAELKMKGAAR